MEKTVIIEGENPAIEDLSPLKSWVKFSYCNDRLARTTIAYWTPYHEIMKCKIFFKKTAKE
jgi:hypothetical protein